MSMNENLLSNWVYFDQDSISSKGEVTTQVVDLDTTLSLG